MPSIPPSSTTDRPVLPGPGLPQRRLVRRGRLFDQLEPGRHRRLTLIHAPAGFGKTTLAAQWRDRLLAEGRAVAWLSIEPDDNRPLWLLSHLAEAVRTVHPGLGDDLHAVLQGHPDQAERYVLSTLVNEIDASGEPLVIVIDDWHRVSDPRTLAALELLLDTASPLLQLVVTSRTRTGLPLGRLRVRDQLVEVDAAALRFDPVESTELLVEIQGLSLLDNDIRDLHQTTDGWVTALQLAALSLRGPRPASSLIEQWSDRLPIDSGRLDAYLAENVLDQLPAEMLDFLLKTALPERICADLSIALTGRRHSLAMLEQIEAEGLFVRPLDTERVWFGYHQLFAAVLRRRLERDHPEQVRELHGRAATWFADAGLTGEAVDHALAAGDPSRAVQIVADRAMPLVERSRMIGLLALADKLPPVHAGDSPRLQLALGWAHCVLQRQDRARVALAQLERAVAAGAVERSGGGSGPGEDGDLVLERRLLRAAITIYSDRVEDTDRLVTEILDRADELRPWLVSLAANLETVTSLQRFDFAAVRSRQAWAEQFHNRSGGPFAGIIALCRAAIAALEQLDVPAAAGYLKLALERSSRQGGRRSYMTQVVMSQLGGLRYQLGELDDAERYLDQAPELGESGMVEFLLTTHVIGARVKAARGDLVAAEARLKTGAAVAARLGLDRLAAAVIEEQARLGLAVDPALEAPRPGPASSATTSAAQGIALVTAESWEGARIRQVLAEAPDSVSVEVWSRLVEIARDRLARIEAQSRPLAALRARVLLAAVLHRARRTAEAESCLLPALRRSAATRLIAPIAEGGAPVAELLGLLRGQTPPIDGVPDALLLRLQQAAAPDLAAAEPGSPSLPLSPSESEPLSPSESGVLSPSEPGTPSPSELWTLSPPGPVSLNERERAILKLLAAGHTNQQIGHRMHLSANTVKWYLRALYPKFGVSRRQECVAVARAQGLLP